MLFFAINLNEIISLFNILLDIGILKSKTAQFRFLKIWLLTRTTNFNLEPLTKFNKPSF